MRPPPHWIERLARIGIIAKAIVYLAVGALAAGVALQIGGVITGGEGVFRLIVSQPLGQVLLGGLGLGLASYTVWLFAQAVFDPAENGTSFIGIINRIGLIITGLAHVALTWEAVRLALGLPGGSDAGIQGLVASVMEAPFGAALLRVAGGIIIVVGLSQIWRGLFGDVRGDWQLHSLDPERHPWAYRVARYGLSSRGVVLGIAGVLVLQAAAQLDPDRAGGVAEVLASVWSQPFSRVLLGVLSLGLVAFGMFTVLEARYRFIPSS